MALNCFVFEKITFFCILATDRQTDEQMDSIDALSYRERRLNKYYCCCSHLRHRRSTNKNRLWKRSWAKEVFDCCVPSQKTCSSILWPMTHYRKTGTRKPVPVSFTEQSNALTRTRFRYTWKNLYRIAWQPAGNRHGFSGTGFLYRFLDSVMRLRHNFGDKRCSRGCTRREYITLMNYVWRVAWRKVWSTRRALGRAHVPPTKVFRRRSE